MRTILPKKLTRGRRLLTLYRAKTGQAINSKGPPFPSEPVIMALLFSQHKLIEWMEEQISKQRREI